MRLILAMGRRLSDAALIHSALDAVWSRHAIEVVIHGGHPGPGAVAEDWARAHDVHVVRYPANWKLHGRRAESARNAFMLADSRPDALLALPGGEETRKLVESADSAGTPIIRIAGRMNELIPHAAAGRLLVDLQPAGAIS